MSDDRHGHPSKRLRANVLLLKKDPLKNILAYQNSLTTFLSLSVSGAHINAHPERGHNSGSWIITLQLMDPHLFIHKCFLSLFLCEQVQCVCMCVCVRTEDRFQRFHIVSQGTL